MHLLTPWDSGPGKAWVSSFSWLPPHCDSARRDVPRGEEATKAFCLFLFLDAPQPSWRLLLRVWVKAAKEGPQGIARQALESWAVGLTSLPTGSPSPVSHIQLGQH